MEQAPHHLDALDSLHGFAETLEGSPKPRRLEHTEGRRNIGMHQTPTQLRQVHIHVALRSLIRLRYKRPTIRPLQALKLIHEHFPLDRAVHALPVDANDLGNIFRPRDKAHSLPFRNRGNVASLSKLTSRREHPTEASLVARGIPKVGYIVIEEFLQYPMLLGKLASLLEEFRGGILHLCLLGSRSLDACLPRMSDGNPISLRGESLLHVIRENVNPDVGKIRCGLEAIRVLVNPQAHVLLQAFLNVWGCPHACKRECSACAVGSPGIIPVEVVEEQRTSGSDAELLQQIRVYYTLLTTTLSLRTNLIIFPFRKIALPRLVRLIPGNPFLR